MFVHSLIHPSTKILLGARPYTRPWGIEMGKTHLLLITQGLPGGGDSGDSVRGRREERVFWAQGTADAFGEPPWFLGGLLKGKERRLPGSDATGGQRVVRGGKADGSQKGVSH